MKRPQEEDVDVEEDNDGSDEDMMDMMTADDGQELMNVDFDFCDLKQDDFHAVRHFLTQLLDGKQYAVSDLADLILNQVEVGTTVGTEGEQIFGFISCLHWGAHADTVVFKQIRKHLVTKCKDATVATALQAYMDDDSHGLGFLVNERIVNLPPLISPPVVSALAQDIQWALDNTADPKEKAKFTFRNFLYVTKVCVHNTADTPAGASSGGSSSAAVRDDGTGHSTKKNRGQEVESFIRLEDSFFAEQAHTTFSYDAPSTSQGERMRRVCMIIAADRLPVVVASLDDFAAKNQ